MQRVANSCQIDLSALEGEFRRIWLASSCIFIHYPREMAKLCHALCISLYFVGAFAKSVEDGKKSGKLSEQEHYKKDGQHNTEYDHEAFLGKQKKTFDELTLEESKERLGWVESVFAVTDHWMTFCFEGKLEVDPSCGISIV